MTLPVTTVAAGFADTPDAYLVVLVVFAFGAYTVPGVPAGLYAVRRAAPGVKTPARVAAPMATAAPRKAASEALNQSPATIAGNNGV